VAKLYATYGQSKVKDLDRKNSTYSLGLDVPVTSAGTIKAALARTKAEVGSVDSTRTTASLGYDHYLSKRTDVYTVLMHDRITDLKSGTSLIAGIRHRF
jgi:predicted porin